MSLGGPATKYAGTFIVPQTTGVPIYFDCVTSEQVTRDAEITEFPVEQGANITDHYRVKLNEVKLEIFVSQEPITTLPHPEGGGFYGAQKLGPFRSYPPASTLATVATAVVNPVGTIAKAIGGLFSDDPRAVTMNSVLQWGAPFDSLASLLIVLDAMRGAAVAFDIYTASQFYSGYMIGQIVTSRSKETGSGARVTLDFKRIAVVTTQLVAAPAMTLFAKDAAPVAKGAQQPQDPGQMTSLASEAVTFVKGVFGFGAP